MCFVCTHCGAYHFDFEQIIATTAAAKREFFNCCERGKVQLPRIRGHPTIKNLILNTNTADGNMQQPNAHYHFKSNIREYNAALCFTLFGVERDIIGSSGGGEDGTSRRGDGAQRVAGRAQMHPAAGVYNFIVNGRVHHYISLLNPQVEDERQFGQLFIIDGEEATERRHEQDRNLRFELLHTLDTLQRDVHRFAQIYRRIGT